MPKSNRNIVERDTIYILSTQIHDRSLSCLGIQEFEDTKEVTGIRKSKDREHNSQQKKDKRTNNDLQNITHKTTDRVTRTPGCELWCSTRALFFNGSC